MDHSQKIIVVGTSAGGRKALIKIFEHFPSEVDIPILIVQHFFSRASNGDAISIGQQEVHYGEHGEHIRNNKIYIASPDKHLLVMDRHIYLSHGPKENGFRPSIDALFRSAAAGYGPNTLGIVLTGRLYDGTSGSYAIKKCGGTTIVQDPEEAEFPSMPESAIQYNEIDKVLKLKDIGEAIREFAEQEIVEEFAVSTDIKQEVAAVSGIEIQDYIAGKGSSFGCPDCGGHLWEFKENERYRYRCRVGHAYTQESLLESQVNIYEESIWMALRILEERILLFKKLMNQKKENSELKNIYSRKLAEVESNAKKLRNFFKPE